MRRVRPLTVEDGQSCPSERGLCARGDGQDCPSSTGFVRIPGTRAQETPTSSSTLHGVESHVTRDASEERAGKYVLKVRLAFHGPMTDEQRSRMYAAVARCPVHKLMTTTEVIIETEPLVP